MNQFSVISKRKYTKTDILNIINKLFELERLDFNIMVDYGSINLEEIVDGDGEYVKWSDIRKLITDIRISNGL